MARIRQVKPVFFLDEDMAEFCSRDARLLFIGMWTIADREGRLEDRPARIKAQIFPYDDDVTKAAVTGWIDELAKGNFIVRYEVGGKHLIWIRTFKQHQHCHNKEQDSQLPKPIKDTKKPGASPVQVPEKHQTCPAASTSTYGIRHTESGERDKPSPRSAKRRSSRKSQKTGAPPEFEISGSLKEWASKAGLNLNLTEETEKFLDYHRAKGSSFADWDAAWKNWMRRAVEYSSKNTTSNSSTDTVGAPPAEPTEPKDWYLRHWVDYVQSHGMEEALAFMAKHGVDWLEPHELEAAVQRAAQDETAEAAGF